MTRTRETMEILRETLGLHPESYKLDERLVELTFGIWEGMTWKEVRKAEPQLAALREQDKWHYAPPGGGESYAMLVERIRPVPRRPHPRHGGGGPWRRRPRLPRHRLRRLRPPGRQHRHLAGQGARDRGAQPPLGVIVSLR